MSRLKTKPWSMLAFAALSVTPGVTTPLPWRELALHHADKAGDERLNLLGTIYKTWGEDAAQLAQVHSPGIFATAFALAQLLPFAALISVAMTGPRLRDQAHSFVRHVVQVLAILLVSLAPSVLMEQSLRGTAPALTQGLVLWTRLSLAVLPYCALALLACTLVRSRLGSFALIAGVLLVLRVAAFQMSESSLSDAWMLSALPQRVMVFHDALLLRASLPVFAWTCLFTATSCWVCWHRRRSSGDGRFQEMRSPMKVLSPSKAISTAILGVCVSLSVTNTASAYGKPGHFRITNAAYQAMRAASAATNPSAIAADLKTPGTCTSSSSLCGRAVSQSEWTSFLFEVEKSRRIIGSQRNQVPNFPDTDPVAAGADCLRYDPPANRVTEDTELAQFPKGLAFNHYEYYGNKCENKGGWQPTSFYEEISPAVAADGTKHGGTALGFHAKLRDDDRGETRVELSFATIPLEWTSTGWQKFGTAFFAPVVCAYKLFVGELNDCLNAARRLADKTNIAGALFAAIPGSGIPRDENYIGFWHLMDVTRGGAYDDHPGMYLTNGGLSDQRSAMDQLLWLVFMTTGAKINRDQSDGVSRYQIRDSDGHQATGDRGPNNLTFAMYNIGNTEFSPLDNLAYYGWEKRKTEQIGRLGWPLHAIGDATVPMHVVATTGQGHRPYEDWVSANIDYLLYEQCPFGTPFCDLRAEQIAQAKRVMQIAFRWREYLNTHGVRDFITALGQDTLSKAGGPTASGWAWCDACSITLDYEQYGANQAEFLGDLTQVSGTFGGLTPGQITKNPHMYYDNQISNIRALVESAIGAKVAFLSWAGKTAYPQCIANERYGCATNSDCCTVAANFGCISNRCTMVPVDLVQSAARSRVRDFPASR